MVDNRLAELEKILGLEFSDKSLLRLAMLHSSYVNEKGRASQSNERLEFLGDAVLSLVVAEYLYKIYPEYSEGNLTELRSALVRRETLCDWANRYKLGDSLYLGTGTATTGGRTLPAILAAAFEALLGALFLERGMEGVREWLLPLVVAELEIIVAEGRHLNFKSRFQVEVQRRFHLSPTYHVLDVTGPEHEHVFEVEVRLGDNAMGRGSGRTKQLAQQAAAKAAFENLEPVSLPDPEQHVPETAEESSSPVIG